MSIDENRLIRLPEVSRLTGLGKSQVYSLAKRGAFPNPLKLSSRCSAWMESEVRGWIGERVAARDKSTAAASA